MTLSTLPLHWQSWVIMFAVWVYIGRTIAYNVRDTKRCCNHTR